MFYQNLWNETEAVLYENSVAFCAYISKEKRLKITTLSLQLKETANQTQRN